MVGDFNVAPLECDVWSHKQLLNVVSHTPIEVEALTRLQASNDWVDLGRHFHPGAAAPPHLVELPLARLDEERPRPPARPYVGDRATSRSWPRRTGSTSPAATGRGRRTMCR